MGRKRFTPERIIGVMRHAKVAQAGARQLT
jgi:hypothetical protein